MKRLVILISDGGTGSNLQAVIDAITKNTLKAKIIGVISDKDTAKGLKRAKQANITTILCRTKMELFPLLQEYNPDYIVLAGWRQIITDEVIDGFQNKILNLHPGIIPDSIEGKAKNPDGSEALWNKGMFTDIAIKNFLDQKATYAGSSIHYLTHEFDFGPVLGRTFEKIQSNDTIETLYKRLKKKENQLYVEVLQKLCN